MKMRKLVGAAVVAFLLYFAVTNPQTAAAWVHTIAVGIASFASALAHGGN